MYKKILLMFLSSFLSCDGWWHYVIYFEKLWRLLSSMDFLNIFIFKFKRSCVLSNSKSEMIFFSIINFLNILNNFVLLIWCYHGECNSFKIFFLWFVFELIWPMKRLVGCLLITMMYQEWVKIEENPPWTLYLPHKMVRC